MNHLKTEVLFLLCERIKFNLKVSICLNQLSVVCFVCWLWRFLYVPLKSNAAVDTAAISMLLSKTKDKSLKESVFLVYNNGKIIYKKEAGEFNAKTQQPIGAASQWLTTALVLMFVQEGKLSLDDKVSDYLPIFSKHGKGYITIGHCLSHNTGIKNDQGVAKIFQKSKFKNLEEEVNDYAAKKEIETNPGTEFNYSNMGFNIAARVLEVISKKPLDRLSQEKLFRPLAMRNTTFANENYNDGNECGDRRPVNRRRLYEFLKYAAE